MDDYAGEGQTTIQCVHSRKDSRSLKWASVSMSEGARESQRMKISPQRESWSETWLALSETIRTTCFYITANKKTDLGVFVGKISRP